MGAEAVRSEAIVLGARMLRTAMGPLIAGWLAVVEARRMPAVDYPQSVFTDAASELIDFERREHSARTVRISRASIT